ncbi:EAL domain-containing protein [Burkholderia ubonensis]|uniref:EAL domain-containing protein n=1 Tax=Burkholderia ubonensis TaxID=101571 RepID=UPI0007563193|nr:EAL domain-containing protein [Burkholderia ubonensis]KWB80668.1 hypothetical protein WL42_10925 [Burkholderia ubonensis]
MLRNQGNSRQRCDQQHVGLNLQNDLLIAVERKGFFVVHQPVVEPTSRDVVSHEALIRWQQPIKGVVMPGSFIEAAEHTHVSVEMTCTVLEQVLRSSEEASGSGLQVPVSVNLSAICLRAGNVSDLIERFLEESAIAPGNLILEITETAMLKQSERVKMPLEALRSLGVKLAMADSGTGYSTLTNLWRYRFQRIEGRSDTFGMYSA